MGGQQTAPQTGNPHLPAVGVACYHQVEAALPVVTGQLRTVGEQDGVAFPGQPGAAVGKLALPLPGNPADEAVGSENRGIVHAADFKELSAYVHGPGFTGEHGDAVGGEPFLDCVQAAGALLVVAGDVEAASRGQRSDPFQKLPGSNQRNLVVNDVAGQKDQVRVVLSERVDQHFLPAPVAGAVQVGDQGDRYRLRDQVRILIVNAHDRRTAEGGVPPGCSFHI